MSNILSSSKFNATNVAWGQGQSALVLICSCPDNWMRGMSACKVLLSRVGQQYADGANLTTQGRTPESLPIELILHTYGKAASLSS